VVRASELRLNGCEFDIRPPHYRSVGTGMGGRLREGLVNYVPQPKRRYTNVLSFVSVKVNTDSKTVITMSFTRSAPITAD